MNLHDLDGKALLTIEETAELLGVSRWVCYRAAQAGELPTISLGRRRLVPTPALKRLLGVESEKELPALGKSTTGHE